MTFGLWHSLEVESSGANNLLRIVIFPGESGHTWENHEINQFLNGEISSVVWRIFGEQEYVECLSLKCVHSLSDDWAFISMYSVTWYEWIFFSLSSSFIWGKMHHNTVAFPPMQYRRCDVKLACKRNQDIYIGCMASSDSCHHRVT